jgi:hypothetical protein
LGVGPCCIVDGWRWHSQWHWRLALQRYILTIIIMLREVANLLFWLLFCGNQCSSFGFSLVCDGGIRVGVVGMRKGGVQVTLIECRYIGCGELC